MSNDRTPEQIRDSLKAYVDHYFDDIVMDRVLARLEEDRKALMCLIDANFAKVIDAPL